MSSNRSLRIEARYHGPPKSGNGGYVCGVLAAEHGAPCEVRLRLPPPLDKSLDVMTRDDGTTVLLDDDAVVAEARSVDVLVDELPVPKTLDEARKASKNFTGFKDHVFPTCFVCGPERETGAGLRIFPGALGDDGIVSAPWKPHPSLADDQGNVSEEFVWAALDCPGAFTNEYRDDGRATVLGSLACSVLHPISIDSEYVVMGWPLGGEGRKAYAGTAVFDESGTLLAYAKATWIWIDVPTG